MQNPDRITRNRHCERKQSNDSYGLSEHRVTIQRGGHYLCRPAQILVIIQCSSKKVDENFAGRQR